jgi:predicted porin
LTFGDKSWGSIKLGKDLGIYASDAILNDMTLLGVGSAAGSLAGNTTTLGRIGRGFMYADWKSQVAYSSPNFNGFSFTAGLTQGWNALNTLNAYTTGGGLEYPYGTSTERSGSQTAYEAKASYEWAGDVSGKVWTSAITQKVEGVQYNPPGWNPGQDIASKSGRATAWDIGATVNVAGFGLTGYYGDGKGIGQTVQFLNGFDNRGKRRDSENWYVQGTYTLPGVGTKLGVSYGESTLDGSRNDKDYNGNGAEGFKELKQTMWTVGAYHPITKHLNLVAEYSEAQDETKVVGDPKEDFKAKTVSLGAILFF